jgi:alkylated DNA repair dioxygenase AlkB
METTAEAPAFQTIQPAVSLKRQETEPFGLNWTSYSTPALHDIVTGSIKELTALSRRGQTELRQRLLPALQEVRNRIAKGEAVDGCATMKAYLSSVGLHEGVIRLWEFRLREKEMQELLGETELAALPFEYEEDFLTPEELAEFETVCKALPWKRIANERNGFDLNEKGEKVWRAYKHYMQLMWCDVRDTHAENKYDCLLGSITDAPAIVQIIVEKLSAHVGRQVNYVSLMCYVGETGHLGWHQHKEDKGHDTPVMIVPCGQERKFSYRLKGSNERHDVLTRNGSLVVLPSSFNDTHEHAILDDKTATGTRYAINAKCMDEIYYGETAAPAESVRLLVQSAPAPEPSNLIAHVNEGRHDVYIGRRITRGKHNFPASIWGNHNHLNLAEYEAYVRSSPELLQQLPSLKGKVLGCWHTVADRRKGLVCHGDVLLKLVNEFDDKPESTAAPAVEDDTELAALFAPLSESELESDRAFESTMVKAPAMETLPPESDLARLRQLFKGTDVEVKKSDHGSKYVLDKLTASQLERIATVLVNV